MKTCFLRVLQDRVNLISFSVVIFSSLSLSLSFSIDRQNRCVLDVTANVTSFPADVLKISLAYERSWTQHSGIHAFLRRVSFFNCWQTDQLRGRLISISRKLTGFPSRPISFAPISSDLFFHSFFLLLLLFFLFLSLSLSLSLANLVNCNRTRLKGLRHCVNVAFREKTTRRLIQR